MASKEKAQGLGLYLTEEPVILALLSAMTVVLFLAVGGLSRMHHAQQGRWGIDGSPVGCGPQGAAL
jgi:hypothetical protein